MAVDVDIRFIEDIRGLNRADSALERLERQVESLERETRQSFRASSQSAQRYEADLRKIELRGVGVGKSLAGLGRLANTAFAAVAAIGVGQAVSGIAKLGIDAEQTQVSFETFLGSGEKARDLIAELNQFSAVTPFRPDEVVQAGRALLAFGIEQEKIIPTLKSVGDISAATGKNFNELAVIYGKARTQGTLFAEDINQLTEAGIPIIDEFARLLNTTPDQVKRLGSEGKITFPLLEQAFTDLTSEGGRFFDLMERQSQTVGGRLSTLQGNVEALFREFGEEGLPVLGNVIDALNRFVQALDPQEIIEFFSPIADKLIPALEEAYNAIGELIDVIFGFNSEQERTDAILGAVTTAFNALVDAITIVVKIQTGIIETTTAIIGKFREWYDNSLLVRAIFDSLTLGLRVFFDILQETWNFITDSVIGETEELGDGVGFAREKFDLLSGAIQKNQEKAKELVAAQDEVKKSTADNSKEVEKLRKEYEKLFGELEKRVQGARLELIDDPVERIREEGRLALEELARFRAELEAAAQREFEAGRIKVLPNFDVEFADLEAAIEKEAQEAIQAASVDLTLDTNINPVTTDATAEKVRRLAEENLAAPLQEGIDSIDEEGIVSKFQRLSDKIADAFGLTPEQTQAIVGGFATAFNTFIQGRQEVLQIEIESQQRIIDNINEKIDEAERALQIELDREREGTANSVQIEQEKIDALQAQREEAQAKQLQLQEDARKQQERIDTLQQVSSLITATANIFKGFSSIPLIGQILAVASVAAMFASFASAKVQARKAAASFAEGGSLDRLGGMAKGPTHAQGGMQGITRTGERFEFEGGEYIVNTKAARENRELLDAINFGGGIASVAPAEVPDIPGYTSPIPGEAKKIGRKMEEAEKAAERRANEAMQAAFDRSFERHLSGQTKILKHALKTQAQYITVDGRIVKIEPDAYGFTESKKEI